jgi:nucleosome binding factor SPN SPT16 subunit
VITLDDIEVAHLERVQFGLKNFDLVFVFKDFTRAPAHINTIPVESLEDVKEFLDSSDIAYSEGPLNLNWSVIMKTVTANPHQFFLDGGWGFLQSDSDDEDRSAESEEESAFEMDDSDLDEVSESSEEGSDFDSNASDEASDEAEMSDEEEGEDWDELERKASKRDRESAAMEEEDRSSKKKQRKR